MQMETNFYTIEKNRELPHYIRNTEVLQYMAGIALIPIYLPVLWFDRQNKKEKSKLDMIKCRDENKLFVFIFTGNSISSYLWSPCGLQIKVADHESTIFCC